MMATNEQNIQVQIDRINQKLDRLLESMEQQDRRREEIDDLVADVNIVAKNAFQQTVEMLDKAGVELDSCGISCLLIKLLQNIDTFREMLELMESARDFIRDVSPVIHQAGLDAIRKLHELESNGTLGHLSAIVKNLSDPGLLNSLNSASRALVTVKMDDKLDNKSLWQLFRELRSPEVRRSLSYSLRLIKAMNQPISN